MDTRATDQHVDQLLAEDRDAGECNLEKEQESDSGSDEILLDNQQCHLFLIAWQGCI